MNKCDSVFEKVSAPAEIQIESEYETAEQDIERQPQEMSEEDEELERKEAFKRERAKLRESTAAFTNAR